MKTIILVNWGIANKVNNFVLMNEKLTKDKYSKFFTRLIKHEYGHTDKKGLSAKDILHEFEILDMASWWQYVKFVVRYPQHLCEQIIPVGCQVFVRNGVRNNLILVDYNRITIILLWLMIALLINYWW